MCRDSNADGLAGGIAEALRGADVCAAFSASGPGIIKPEWVRNMARDAIVFACANPVPRRRRPAHAGGPDRSSARPVTEAGAWDPSASSGEGETQTGIPLGR